MRKLHSYTVFLIVLLVCTLTTCTHQQKQPVPYSGNAVYYWRTTWQLSDSERTFLKSHNVRRIYLRLFDVVPKFMGDSVQGSLVPMPEATLHFNEPYDAGCEVIPVVFITDDCLSADTLLADKVVTRVAQFCETNDLVWHELQVDCDWHESTREVYFRFLQRVHQQLCAKGDYRLSATIRLHQFSQPAPPVDYGMLMCYNTGNLADKPEVNAVLTTGEVKKFAGKLADYQLPLCVGYPLFTWKRLFRNGKFVALLRDADLSDNHYFQNCGNGIYRVSHSLSVASPDPTTFGLRLFAGDTVKYDFVPADTILAVAKILEKQNADLHQQVVLYSLNENDFSKYTQDEIEDIYTFGK